jgi:hypothetical protein
MIPHARWTYPNKATMKRPPQHRTAEELERTLRCVAANLSLANLQSPLHSYAKLAWDAAESALTPPLAGRGESN